VDSNVFIYPIIYDETKVPEVSRAKGILIEIAEGRLKACSSVLTWDEIVYVVRKISNAESSIKAGRNFMAFPNLEILNVNQEILRRAQEVMERYNLLPRDALHVASAIENKASEIISSDSVFDRIEEVKWIKL
jgi:hypothetical protein